MINNQSASILPRLKSKAGEVVQLIVSFLEPPFQSIINKEELFKNWNSDKKRYQ